MVTRTGRVQGCYPIVTITVDGNGWSSPHGVAGTPTVATAGSVLRVTRIIAGSLGGRRLVVPTGRAVRPTSDRVREGLFNTLGTLVDLAGARFLDLYAGSGAVGIEAYSRGAAAVLLVESDPKAVRAIRSNIDALGLAPTVTLSVGSVRAVLASGTPAPYDVVFIDPPYDLPQARLVEVQQVLADAGWLASGAVLVIERATRSGAVAWVDPVTTVRARRYGETTLWYGRRS